MGKLPSNPHRELTQNQIDLSCDTRWSYDEDTKIITTEMTDHPIQPKGLGYFIYENMKKHLDNIAQINMETGDSDTYRDLLLYATRTAIELKKRGVKPGDVVTSYSYNQKYAAVVYIATTFIGAIITNIDTTLQVCDVKHLIKLVQPKIIFVSDDCEENIDLVITELGLETEIVAYSETSTNINKFSEFILKKDKEEEFEPYICEDSSETIIILFSSGTTGLPKGICLHHQHIIFLSTKYNTPRALTKNTLYWIGPALNVPGCANSGTARCYMTKYDPKQMWHYIEKYNIPYVYITPYYALEMVDHRPANHITSLAYLAIVGNGTSDENIKKIKAAMPKTIVVCPYGQTEGTPTLNAVPLVDDNNLQGIGKPGFGYSYKVVDPETEQALGFGEVGELRLKHKYHMNGYYKEDTSYIFDSFGFMKTGDLAFYNEKFVFHIVDRYKEMFKYRGVHIVPAKLENILSEHPEVIASIVLGIPHNIDECHAMVVVSVRNRNKVTAEEIVEFINERVAVSEKIRAGVKFVEEFPLTPSGKLARHTLKKMVLNGQI